MTPPAPTYPGFRCREKILDFSQPRIIGILNTTPDSFSDGGLFLSRQAATDRIGEMVEEGADIIDIGGESTRPGSDPVSEKVEMERVLPVLENAITAFPNTLFSVDTTKFGVAKGALDLGVHIINDVSGLQKEPRLADLCLESKAGYILMHSQGDPKTMQKNPVYSNIIKDLNRFFREKLEHLQHKGIHNVIIDPGIGFGKTLEHNLKIVSNLDHFTEHGVPILAGASRKSMIGRVLDGRPVDQRLAGTISLHYHCLLKGASLLRVHDVREAVDSIRIFVAVQNEKLKTNN